jgi:hypothetical protein
LEYKNYSHDICPPFKYSKDSKEKGNAMSTTDSYAKVIPSRRALIIGIIALVFIALVAVYIWIMTAQTITPPGLRILDFFWTIFSWPRA